MIRERALKVVLVLVGLFFLAFLIPIFERGQSEVLQMMASVYATLGVFLLLAVRNPSAHRSLIAFTAWSSFAHAATMVGQSFYDVEERGHLLSGVVLFAIVGILFIVLAPARSDSRAGNEPQHSPQAQRSHAV